MQTAQPVVYVVQDMGLDYTPALKYGSVEALLESRDELNMVNSRAIIRKLRFGLAKMTEHDYLVLVGNPVAMGLAMTIATQVTGGCFKVLKWNNQEHTYIPITINMQEAAA